MTTAPDWWQAHVAQLDPLTRHRANHARALAQRLSVRPRFVDYTERFGE